MVVYSKDELKNALKKGERHIEIQGNYAEELMQKYNQYLMAKPAKTNWLGPLFLVPQPICTPIIKPNWVEMLKYYDVESYSKERLVLHSNLKK